MNVLIYSFLVLIFLLATLVVAKLLHDITWSWWLVTSPAWLVFIIVVFVFFILSNLNIQ